MLNDFMKRVFRTLLVSVVLLIAIAPLRAQDAPSGEIEFAFRNYGPDALPGWEKIIAEFNKDTSLVISSNESRFALEMKR